METHIGCCASVAELDRVRGGGRARADSVVVSSAGCVDGSADGCNNLINVGGGRGAERLGVYCRELAVLELDLRGSASSCKSGNSETK